MHYSLLYVSKSTFSETLATDVVGQITATAIAANSQTGLTGALVFTGTHFAQILEGGRFEIDKLMASIQRDQRHTELMIVERKDYAQRRFSDWSLAYMGPSAFVSGHVTRLLDSESSAGAQRASRWMSELMVEFARAA